MAGITAVDDLFGTRNQILDDIKLLLDALIIFQFNAKPRRNHGQLAQAPPFPLVGVVVGLLEFTQVAKSPRHLIATALKVAIVPVVGTKQSGNVACHTWFLGNANFHFLLVFIY